MSFYVPRTMATMQQPQAQNMGGTQRQMSPMTSGYNTQTQVPEQQKNPMSSIGNAVQAYKTGKGAMNAVSDIGNWYDRMTMPSGVNSAGTMSEMYSPLAANSEFLSAGGEAATTPLQSMHMANAGQAAADSAFMGAPTSSAMTTAAANPLVYSGAEGASLMGDAAVGSGLSAAGPSGILEGAGLMGGAESGAGLLGAAGTDAALAAGTDAALSSGAAAMGGAAAGEAAGAGATAALGASSMLGPLALGGLGIYGLGSLLDWW